MDPQIESRLRPHQVEPANRLLTCLATGNAVDMSDCGIGKCLKKGTQVLRHSGELAKIEDIKPGDALMGDDGTPRNVLKCSQGFGPLYTITPTRGEPWICNGEHILVLTSLGCDAPYRYWTKGEEKEISVNDFLKLPQNERHNRWKLFSSAGWERPEAVLEIAPYIYGLWLGDGCATWGSLTSMDAEIKKEWVEFFESRQLRVYRQQDHRSKAEFLRPTIGNVGGTSNWWLNFVRSSCNGKEKFILPEYLNGSKAQRLQLLAGLLDSDGHLCGGLNTFEISQKSKRLTEQISFLARSLGFFVTCRRNYKTCQTGKGGFYFRMCISGDTARIPTRLPRKRATERKQYKRHNVQGFSIAPAGDGEYFGVVIDSNRRFLLADATVTHNTYAACAIAATLKLPTLVLCPLAVVTSWHRAAAHFSDTLSVIGYEACRTGKTPFGRWENPKPKGYNELSFSCSSCQCKFTSDLSDLRPCQVHGYGIHCLVAKKIPWKLGKFIWNDAIRFLIFDECHRAGALKSQNAELLIAARRQGIKTLMLSATLAGGPLSLRAIGYALDLFPLTGYWRWAQRHGVGRINGLPGMHWAVGAERKLAIMAKIRDDILPARGVAVSTKNIPGFPSVSISAELYDISDTKKIDAAYADIELALAALDNTELTDADSDHPLTRLLRARQRIELCKISLFAELASDAVAKGNSVGIFLNFSASIDQLAKLLRIKCIIDGSEAGVANRQQNIDDFQAGRERIIICNSQAGGIGISLHDTTGDRPRIGFVSPPQSAVIFRQLCGRFPREGGKSPSSYRVVLAANSVEEQVKRGLDAKLSAIDSLRDADFLP